MLYAESPNTDWGVQKQFAGLCATGNRAATHRRHGEPDEAAAHWREYFDGTSYERCPAGSGYNAVVGKLSC